MKSHQNYFYPNYQDFLFPVLFPCLIVIFSGWPTAIDFSSAVFWAVIVFFTLYSLLIFSFFPKIIVTDQAIIFKGLFGLPISKQFNFCDIQQVWLNGSIQSSRTLEIKSKTEFSPKICESNYAGFDQIVVLLKLHVDIKTIEPVPHQPTLFSTGIGVWLQLIFWLLLTAFLFLMMWLDKGVSETWEQIFTVMLKSTQ